MGPLEQDSPIDSGALAAFRDINAPLRPKASPRLTPSTSVHSSFSFRSASNRAGSATSSSEDASPTRGRTLARVPAHERVEPRAMTRFQTGPDVGALDRAVTRQRFLSCDLSEEPEDLDGYLMEPLPYEKFGFSLSEELHKAATFNGTIDLTSFGGYRDTFAILSLHRMQVQEPELPATFFQRLLDYIDFDAYLAIRLSCRCWSDEITLARPIVTASVYRLPAEILGNIYARLSPVDLNAARHTCRAWMIGSLQERLLKKALKEGGWWRAARADMDLHEEMNGHRTADSINEEWLLSKRFAIECSLRSDWTGNGLCTNPSSSQNTECNQTGIALVSMTDFSEISTGYIPSRLGGCQYRSAVHFTVSVCSKYLLVTEGCLIYIYSLRDDTSISHPRGGRLWPVTTIVCPHRVLAVSMDTSSQRFAVAALLDGRVGLVCDLHEQMPSSSHRRSTSQSLSNITRDCKGSVYSSVSSVEPLLSEATREYATLRANSSDRHLARAIAETSLPEFYGARDVRTSWHIHLSSIAVDSGPSGGSSSNIGYIPPMAGPIPLESGIRSIYRNLCSAEDPPRSVAICPQRRCIAFGCSAGIELHWIDALTGRDLNRWFPLTAPSDFLYFLPPRPGVDSAKKLRLISSACHPEEKEGLGRRFFPGTGTNAARHGGMTWDEGPSDPRAWDNAWKGSGWSDHYRAVPISDGWNILFTDPVEGNLCLGTDAPPGVGTTKLTRRFIFTGPTEFEKTVVPRVYTAGSELRWGIRIAVGYQEDIWLFVLPPDYFFAHDNKRAEGQDRQEPDAVEEPTRIEGVRIGHMEGLVDLAVDASGGDLTIWSFGIGGMAYAWQLTSRQQSVEQKVVLKDGTVTALVDADGDTYMSNTSQAAVHFDGAEPLRPTCTNTAYLHPSPQSSIHSPFFDPQDRAVDDDGDITMPDADEEDEGYASGDDEMAEAGGVFAIHTMPLWDSWSEEDADWVPDYLAQRGGEIEEGGVGVDVLGLTRLEVEVLCG